MRILCCGDVVGKSGRQAILKHIPELRERLDLDFVVVNGENAAHGFGITEAMCRAFHDVEVDVITTGNHVWDRREIVDHISADPRLLRPLNYPEGTKLDELTKATQMVVQELRAEYNDLPVQRIGFMNEEDLDAAIEQEFERLLRGSGGVAGLADSGEGAAA